MGHWDGDTLVVETAGFNDLNWLDRNGHPHIDAHGDKSESPNRRNEFCFLSARTAEVCPAFRLGFFTKPTFDCYSEPLAWINSFCPGG